MLELCSTPLSGERFVNNHFQIVLSIENRSRKERPTLTHVSFVTSENLRSVNDNIKTTGCACRYRFSGNTTLESCVSWSLHSILMRFSPSLFFATRGIISFNQNIWSKKVPVAYSAHWDSQYRVLKDVFRCFNCAFFTSNAVSGERSGLKILQKIPTVLLPKTYYLSHCITNSSHWDSQNRLFKDVCRCLNRVFSHFKHTLSRKRSGGKISDVSLHRTYHFTVLQKQKKLTARKNGRWIVIAGGPI